MAEFESLVGQIHTDESLRGLMNMPQGGGTTDYELLRNKPQIEGVTLIGNKTFEELTLVSLTNEELEALLY